MYCGMYSVLRIVCVPDLKTWRLFMAVYDDRLDERRGREEKTKGTPVGVIPINMLPVYKDALTALIIIER